MTYEEERELIKLTKENNIMLKQIIQYINIHGNHTDDGKEFIMNVVANLISNNLYGNNI